MDSSLTNFEVVLPSEVATVTATILIMIMITNTLTLLTFKHMKKLQLQHYLMICLAVVDLLTVFPHLVSLIGFLNRFLKLSDALCKTTTVYSVAVIAGTTWIQCAICIDRYFSILRPLKHRRFVTNHRPAHLAVWISMILFFTIFAIILTSVLTGFMTAQFNPILATCMFRIDWSYAALCGSLFIVIPLSIVLLTHGLILNELRKANSKIRKKIKKSMPTVMLIVGTFYTCWIPYSVFIIWQVFSVHHSSPPKIFELVAVYFLVTNSVLNFFIYVVTNAAFRNTFKTRLCLFRCINSVQPQ